MLVQGFIIAAIIGILRRLILTWRRLNIFAESLPWIGRRKEIFSALRACARQMFRGVESMAAGYREYSMKGQCFVLPDAGLRPHVMIPPEQIRWFVEQSESTLAAHGPLRESVGIPYLIPTMDQHHNMYVMDVVRKDLTRNLGKLQPEIFADLKESIDNLFGMEENHWHEITLYETLQTILFKSFNRAFVGMPLCTNNVFLRSSAAFSNLLGIGAVLVGELLPLALKPLVGYPLALPIYIAEAMSYRYLVPEIEYRMANIRHKSSDPSFEWDEPKDMLTWIVVAAMERGDAEADQPHKIAQALLFMMLGGIHTSIVTSCNVMFDLLSSDPKSCYYNQLREETDVIFANDEDWNEHMAVGKLSHVDSAIRESLRRSPVITKNVLREVIKEDGLRMPNGQHLPKGTWAAVPSVGLHFDNRFYPDAQRYDPFRFVRDVTKEMDVTDNISNPLQEEKVEAPTPKQRKNQNLSNTSETYMAFGHGRRSCPGRFFAAVQLKLLIAYIVRHYHFEPLEHRPLNKTFGGHIVPSMTAKVKLRRRKGY